MEKRVRSTRFKKDRPIAKEEQEETVAQVFREEYARVKGVALDSGTRVKREPPDWLFTGPGLTVSVEMFELYQFYPSRALVEALTNAIYGEFEGRGLSEAYRGTMVAAGELLTVDTDRRLQEAWKAKGIRSPVRQTAIELVDVLAHSLRSRDAVPKGDFGVRVDVDPGAYPALAVFCRSLWVHRVREEDERRSDRRAAPLVMLSPGYDYSDDEMTQQVQEKISEKMAGRSRWSVAGDRSVLLAHDLPRGEMYEGFAMKWDEWVKGAAIGVNALHVFDEVWLVTCQTLRGGARVICSREQQ
jgi:hypothetical protein